VITQRIRALSAVISFAVVIVLTGCSSTSTDSSAPNESISQATPTETSSGVSSTEVCNGIGTAYRIYQTEFSDFRYGPSSTPWQVFYDLSDKASGSFQDVAGQIENYGIDWDSGAIVSSIIYSAADRINSIKEYTSQNYFPPGSDLQTLLDQIDVDVNSVLGSSCNGGD
jgi:hypothetical protein